MKELFIKVIVWRAVSVVSMLLTMWMITGDLVKSTSVTIIVQIVQTVVHAIFESLWGKSRGRNEEKN
jgi:uncharacterized membrane protein